MRCIRRGPGALAALLVMATGVAYGQTAPATSDWSRAGFLAVYGGGGEVTSRHGFAAGAGLGWDVTRRLTLEGRGRWFDAPPDESAFAVDLVARYAWRPGTRIAPFVSGGVGMLRAVYEAIDADSPEFYRERAVTDVFGRSRGVFRDLLWSVGGGGSMFLTRHLALRPEVGVLIITTTESARVVPVYGVQLAYHFEPKMEP